jgi:hypothetical protein
MKLFLFILPAVLASCAGHVSTNKDASIPSTIRFDANQRVITQSNSPTDGRFTVPGGKDIGYGVLWRRATYETTESNGVIIQNSFPKGGAYTDPGERRFEYRIFCTRVINETGAPLEITISFPADSIVIFPAADAYFKVLLPPDTMSIDKVILYDYGATGLKSFFDTGLNNPTMLRRTVNPKEEFFFYTCVLTTHSYGAVRAGLVMSGQNLFYKIVGLGPHLIPCGKLEF